MDEQVIHLIPVLAAAIISAGLAAYAWQHRAKPGVTAFAGLMLAVTEWLLAGGFRMMSASPEAARFWFNATFVGVASVPVVYLIFVMQYTGRETWLTRRRLLLLMLVPLITQIVVWTNPVHGLFLQNVDFSRQGSLMSHESKVGAWFVVHTLYSYLLVLFAILVMLSTIVRSHRLYRRQAAVLLLATVPSLAPNVVRMLGLVTALHDLIMPLGFTLTGLILAWDLFRYQLLDIVPVAKDVLIDSIGAGMVVLDAQNRIIDINPAAQTILDLSPAEVVGQSAAEALSSWPDLTASLSGETGAHAEIASSPRGSPQRHYYDLRISPVVGRGGRFRGRLIVLHDITERKRAEQALRQRTAELEVSNAELDAFAHTVAHDLKNPLNAIFLCSDLSEDEFAQMSPEGQCGLLRAVDKSARRMNWIIDELLLLSRVRQQEIERQPVDMGQVVPKAIDRLDYLIAQHQAEILLPDDWPPALGYAPWLEEVWANYVSNAIKYGGRPPRVECGATRQSDGFVRFWIKDNGAGLAPEAQEQLFTPFTRLHQTQAEGYGLGLTIVQRIVVKLGGQVAVMSELGQGSIFAFTLPGWSQ